MSKKSHKQLLAEANLRLKQDMDRRAAAWDLAKATVKSGWEAAADKWKFIDDICKNGNNYEVMAACPYMIEALRAQTAQKERATSGI